MDSAGSSACLRRLMSHRMAILVLTVLAIVASGSLFLANSNVNSNQHDQRLHFVDISRELVKRNGPDVHEPFGPEEVRADHANRVQKRSIYGQEIDSRRGWSQYDYLADDASLEEEPEDGFERFQESLAEAGKLDNAARIFKERITKLRTYPGQKLDLIFVLDASSSVGEANFRHEVGFVQKLLSDFAVTPEAVRVAVVTFASAHQILRQVDHVSQNATPSDSGDPLAAPNKCSLIHEELPGIVYTGGGTHTSAALREVVRIIRSSRDGSKKVVFLITDGYSNGGDPRGTAAELRKWGTEIFTFGIIKGNTREFYDMASAPKAEHTYILSSFGEFETLARLGLRKDLTDGAYVRQPDAKCSTMCNTGLPATANNNKTCCSVEMGAFCSCGITSGHYVCLCPPGHFGTGMNGDCTPCPAGTYKPIPEPGDQGSCIPCPDPHHFSQPGSESPSDCKCKPGFIFDQQAGSCQAIKCPPLPPPDNGYFIGNACSNDIQAACGIRCHPGHFLKGSAIRVCQPDLSWSGKTTTCIPRRCPKPMAPLHGAVNCSYPDFRVHSECVFSCEDGFMLVGSERRSCLPVALWSGITPKCKPVTCLPLPKVKNGKIQPPSCSKTWANPGKKCEVKCDDGFSLRDLPAENVCGNHGRWNVSVKSYHCLDSTPPKISCPGNVEVDNEPDGKFGLVFLKKPEAKDNSEADLTVTSKPVLAEFPMKFPIGTHEIEFAAEDQAGNVARCNVTVVVKDVEAPVATNCPPGNHVQLVTSSEDDVTTEVETPEFWDNSGGPLEIRSNLQSGSKLKQGRTAVTFTATDSAGHQANCSWDILVQSHYCIPPEQSDCVQDGEKIDCQFHCGTGNAVFYAATASLDEQETFTCWKNDTDGKWNGQLGRPEAPLCSEKLSPNTGVSSGTLEVDVSDYEAICQDVFFLKQMANRLQIALGAQIMELCEEYGLESCDVATLEVTCEQVEVTSSEEESQVWQTPASLPEHESAVTRVKRSPEMTIINSSDENYPRSTPRQQSVDNPEDADKLFNLMSGLKYPPKAVTTTTTEKPTEAAETSTPMVLTSITTTSFATMPTMIPPVTTSSPMATNGDSSTVFVTSTISYSTESSDASATTMAPATLSGSEVQGMASSDHLTMNPVTTARPPTTATLPSTASYTTTDGMFTEPAEVATINQSFTSADTTTLTARNPPTSTPPPTSTVAASEENSFSATIAPVTEAPAGSHQPQGTVSSSLSTTGAGTTPEPPSTTVTTSTVSTTAEGLVTASATSLPTQTPDDVFLAVNTAEKDHDLPSTTSTPPGHQHLGDTWSSPQTIEETTTTTPPSKAVTFTTSTTIFEETSAEELTTISDYQTQPSSMATTTTHSLSTTPDTSATSTTERDDYGITTTSSTNPYPAPSATTTSPEPSPTSLPQYSTTTSPGIISSAETSPAWHDEEDNPQELITSSTQDGTTVIESSTRPQPAATTPDPSEHGISFPANQPNYDEEIVSTHSLSSLVSVTPTPPSVSIGEDESATLPAEVDMGSTISQKTQGGESTPAFNAQGGSSSNVHPTQATVPSTDYFKPSEQLPGDAQDGDVSSLGSSENPLFGIDSSTTPATTVMTPGINPGNDGYEEELSSTMAATDADYPTSIPTVSPDDAYRTTGKPDDSTPDSTPPAPVTDSSAGMPSSNIESEENNGDRTTQSFTTITDDPTVSPATTTTTSSMTMGATTPSPDSDESTTTEIATTSMDVRSSSEESEEKTEFTTDPSEFLTPTIITGEPFTTPVTMAVPTTAAPSVSATTYNKTLLRTGVLVLGRAVLNGSNVTTDVQELVRQLVEKINGSAEISANAGIDEAMMTTIVFKETIEALCPDGSEMKNGICVKCPRGYHYDTTSKRCSQCGPNSYQPQEGQLVCLACPEGQFTEDGPLATDVTFCKRRCRPGMYSPTGLEPCIPCNPGAYQDAAGQRSCKLCGTEDMTESPALEDDQGVASRPHNAEKCSSLCAPDHASADGMQPCWPCPNGTIQPEHGRSSCLLCQEKDPSSEQTNSSRPSASSLAVAGFEYAQDSHISTDSNAGKLIPGPCDLGSSKREAVVVPFNGCFSHPCQNNGTCIPLSETLLFSCECPPSFSGDYCETPLKKSSSKECLPTEKCEEDESLKESFDVSNTSYAETRNPCGQNPCYNGGTCQMSIEPSPNGSTFFSCQCSPGFHGKSCDLEEECAPGKNPCRNNGTCVPTSSGYDYECNCTAGFSGPTCDEAVSVCANDSPCLNGGSCSEKEGIFQCACPTGFYGNRCQRRLRDDPCESNPCLHGSCIFIAPESTLDRSSDGSPLGLSDSDSKDDSYTCACDPAWDGKNCEIKLTDRYVLEFPYPPSAVPSMAIYEKGFSRGNPRRGDLEEISVCLWIMAPKSAQDVQGTPFSYATSASPDAFTLSNLNGFVFTINGVELNTNVTANDGSWHHICAGWRSVNGRWALWKDGTRVAMGQGLAAGQTVPGDGILVLGQEQDSFGGRFSTGEAFVGKMANVEFWTASGWLIDEPQSDRVARLMYSCEYSKDNKGDLLTWADFQDKLKGPLLVHHHRFCERCAVSSTDLDLHGLNQTAHMVSNSEEILDVTQEMNRRHAPGRTLRFRCLEGYEIRGGDERSKSAVLRCRVDGTWHKQLPKCERVICEPEEVVGGRPILILGNGSEFGSRVRYKCSDGHYMEDRNQAERTCQADGTWSGRLPVCRAKACSLGDLSPRTQFRSDPPLQDRQLSHGEEYPRHELSAEPETVLTLTCDKPGYALQGNLAEIKCSPSGHWEPYAPACLPEKCTEAPSLPHGTIEDFVPGVHVEFDCREGYELEGNSTVQCRHNQWLGEFPVCKPRKCGNTPEVPNATLKTLTGWLFKDTATYECLPGFHSSVKTTYTCSSMGDWVLSAQSSNREVKFSCDRLKCPTAPEILAGTRQERVNKDGSTSVVYKCNEGYVLRGSTTHNCTHGSWPKAKPTCVKPVCKTPPMIPKATFRSIPLFGDQNLSDPISGPWERGEELIVTCLPGYELKGPKSRIFCREDGSWGVQLPSCEPKLCFEPPSIPHGQWDWTRTMGQLASGEPQNHGAGRKNRPRFPFQAHVFYECLPGYVLEGSDKLACSLDGRWSPPVGAMPECLEARCPPLANIASGSFYRSQDETAGKIQLITRCSYGYFINGSSSMECTTSGNWSTLPPRCHEVKCPMFEPIVNGKILATGQFVDAVAEVKCKEGFNLAGDWRRVCREDGNWSGRLPTCNAVKCPQIKPNDFHVRFRLSKGRLFKSKVFYSCAKGYKLAGNTSEQVCSMDGSWSPPGDPECQALPAPCNFADIDLANGQIESIAAGWTRRFKCDPGYVLFGESTITCFQNGSLSAMAPTCEPLKCKKLKIPRDGSIQPLEEEYEAGRSVKFGCTERFTLIGEETATCLATQGWSSSPPTCEPILCPEMPDEDLPSCIETIYSTDPTDVVDGTAMYSFGSTMTGNSSNGDILFLAICSQDGRWDMKRKTDCPSEYCSYPELGQNSHPVSNATKFPVGCTVYYACDPGFTKKSSKESIGRYCNEKKQWHPEALACVARECAPIAWELENGSVFGDSASVTRGSVVNFTCGQGYQLYGSESTTCQEDGTWSAMEPSCRDLPCPPPAFFNNSQYTLFESPEEGLRLIFSCQPGYFIPPPGIDMATCDPVTGQWSYVPRCSKVTCDPVWKIEHGLIVGKSFEFGDKLAFKCHDGFAIQGDGIIECTKNGTWSADLPRCELTTCLIDGLPNILDGRWTATSGALQVVSSTSQKPGYDEAGSNMTIECDSEHGFQLAPSIAHAPNATCLSNGQWSFDETTGVICVPKSCPKPHTHDGVQLLAPVRQNWSVNSTIYFKCTRGWGLSSGDTTQTCLLDGTWSGLTPKCHRTSCPDEPEPFLNGWKDFTLEGTIYYHCNEGFVLANDSTAVRSCTSSGKLVPEAEPDCILAPEGCVTLPDAPKHAEASVIAGRRDMFEPGETLEFRCIEGYEMKSGGQNGAVCLENGSWTPVDPDICAEVLCPELKQEIENGRVIVQSRKPSAEAIYECFEAYYLEEGMSRRVCLSSGVWSDPVPKCMHRCQDLPNFSHGTVLSETKNGYLARQDTFLKCNRGYRLNYGNGAIQCKVDSSTSKWKWIANGKCVPVTCPRLEMPQSFDNNRGVIVQKEDMLLYKCHLGFVAKGPTLRKCSSKGIWEFVLEDENAVSDVSQTSSIVSNNGTEPKCDPILCDLKQLTVLMKNAYEHNKKPAPHGIRGMLGHVIEYRCHAGYRFDPNYVPKEGVLKEGDLKYPWGNAISSSVAEIRCLDGGKWAKIGPDCILKDCNHTSPPEFPHATIQSIDQTEANQATAIYRCDKGYKLPRNGDDKVRCRFGRWENIVRINCQPVLCGRPPIPKNGMSHWKNLNVGSNVTFSCWDGFDLDDPRAVMRCFEAGEWEGRVPKCTPKKCPVPEAVPEGDFILSPDKSTVEYRCRRGFHLRGPMFLYCDKGGKWSGTPPSCERVRCPRLQTPNNGSMKNSSQPAGVFGSTVEFACDKNFRLVGSSLVTCSSSGDWYPSLPKCKVITCGPPAINPLIHGYATETQAVQEIVESPRNPRLRKNSVRRSRSSTPTWPVGSVLTLHCVAPGAYPKGNMTINCGEDGIWSSPEGSCDKSKCGVPILRHGAFIPSFTQWSSGYIWFSCPPGKVPQGTKWLKCGRDNRWDRDAVCISNSTPMPPSCPRGCLNGGACRGFHQCSCPKGFTGRRCEHTNCPYPCLNGGKCVGPYRCECPSGFRGSRCQTPVCNPACQNGGICISGNRCYCDRGFKGPTCNLRVPVS